MPAWPRFDAETDAYLAFDDTIVAKEGLHEDACDFRDELAKTP